jgi:hypothetical protein
VSVDAVDRRRTRRGSALSDRQIAYSVRTGQRIAVLLPLLGDVEVAGYAFGLDDYHLGLVTRDGQRLLIHKSAHLMFSREGTYANEPRREELEALVAPFRRWVERVHFGHTAAPEPPTG